MYNINSIVILLICILIYITYFTSNAVQLIYICMQHTGYLALHMIDINLDWPEKFKNIS